MSWALLIVEDDDDIRETLAALLEARGFLTAVAKNGADALAVTAHGIQPALIVLDLVMPVMDGIEFLERQNEVELLADVPVIVVTAQPERARDLPANVRAVVPKPFSVGELLAAIETVCASIVGRPEAHAPA